MGFEGWLAVAVVAIVFLLLGLTRISTDVAFVGGLSVLLIAGVVSPAEAFSGFANPGVITVAVLYLVVAGVRETGGIQWIVHHVLGKPHGLGHAQIKLMVPAAAISAFLNNTPVVAMLIPAVNDWARKFNLAPSKLMIPLSYAAILGGTCTVIGTSTNLVVNGLLLERSGTDGLHLLELAWVGVPIAVIGLAFIMLTSRWLLPDRRQPVSRDADPRAYAVEMVVQPGSPLEGKTIEEAGLRHLGGTYVAEIDRGGRVLPAVSPDEPLQSNDRLVFVGVVDSVVELQKIRGLAPATDQVFKLDGARSQRALVEAVVSDTCPLVGHSIREGQFRSRYRAVVIAVARNGERIKSKVGDIVLRPGDTLLLEAQPGFTEEQRNSRDFFLVSQIDDSHPPRHERGPVALGVLGLMIVLAASGVLSMLEAALLAGALMLLTRCCSADMARRSIDWTVLIVIGAAFGIGMALDASGAASAIALSLTELAGTAPWFNLAIIYVVTALFTAIVTNNAAAVLMFPIAQSIAADLEVSIFPFAVAIMLGASASFATPMGYQTNLMVYGPGAYRFVDYIRIGLPLTLVTGVTAVVLIPLVWPF